jgi:cytochrome c peroxidase
MSFRYPLIFLSLIALVFACKKDNGGDDPFKTTPYNFPQPSNFRAAEVDPANPLTEEGVKLGHRLFFERQLSKDGSLSCAGCHRPENAFSDPRRFSLGVDGTPSKRQAMSLINLAWSDQFFWDGRSATLREQALLPVPDPTEMHLSWQEAVTRLQGISGYPELFNKAFGTDKITKELVANALEQYQKALVSYNAPFDKYLRGEGTLSPSAMRGMQMFNDEKADCFHCHSTPEMFVHPAQIFGNNGLDLVDNLDGFADKGLGGFTGNPQDNGRFKVPSLRNLTMTAPYMHDGRFQTLDEVIDFYNEGPKISPTLDPIMIAEANRRVLQFGRWGLGLTPQEKADLKAFLVALTDSTILSNPLFRPPLN